MGFPTDPVSFVAFRPFCLKGMYSFSFRTAPSFWLFQLIVGSQAHHSVTYFCISQVSLSGEIIHRVWIDTT